MIKVMLAVPRKGNCLEELQRFLNQEIADIYVFPEGVLTTEYLQQALSIIRTNRKYVITGYKDLDCNGQHKVLVIDSGEIVDEYIKCILTKGENLRVKTPEKQFGVSIQNTESSESLSVMKCTFRRLQELCLWKIQYY